MGVGVAKVGAVDGEQAGQTVYQLGLRKAQGNWKQSSKICKSWWRAHRSPRRMEGGKVCVEWDRRGRGSKKGEGGRREGIQE